MNCHKKSLIHLVLILTGFVSQGVGKCDSLKDIYKTGKVRFIPELTIDNASMPEDVFLESAVDIKCDRKGYVYVCDYRANDIKVFDEEGTFFKTIGRKGQGPGELSRPYVFAVTDDRLIIWNMGNRRLDALTKDGEFIKSVYVSLIDGAPRMMRALPNGNVVVASEKVYFGELDKPQEYFIDIYSPDLEKKKRIYVQKIWRNKFVRKGDGIANIPVPFSPRVYWDVSPKGEIVIGYSRRYEIKIYDMNGEKVSSFSHAYTPQKVINEDKKRFFALIASSSGGRIRRGASDFIVKHTKFPKIKPAFQQIKVDSEGNILVMVYRKNRDEEGRFFDVFDSQGNFLGDVQIIGEIGFPYFSVIKEGTFWQQEANESGFIKIIKYRISKVSTLSRISIQYFHRKRK